MNEFAHNLCYRAVFDCVSRKTDHYVDQSHHTPYTLFQNGRHFSILLFDCKLALLNFAFESEAKRANLQSNKIILKWRPFWNKVHV